MTRDVALNPHAILSKEQARDKWTHRETNGRGAIHNGSLLREDGTTIYYCSPLYRWFVRCAVQYFPISYTRL